MKIYVAHPGNFDYEVKLYGPLRNSPLNQEHEFILPHEQDERTNSKELIQGVDLMLADVSVASTSEGVEIGWADAVGTRIVCMHERGARIPSSISLVTDTILDYGNPEELIAKLSTLLAQG